MGQPFYRDRATEAISELPSYPMWDTHCGPGRDHLDKLKVLGPTASDYDEQKSAAKTQLHDLQDLREELESAKQTLVERDAFLEFAFSKKRKEMTSSTTRGRSRENEDCLTGRSSVLEIETQ